MEKYYITISRQFGSLGRPIARELSEILGIEYYDRDIVDDTASKLNLPRTIVDGAEEKAAGNSFFNMLFPLGMDSSEQQDKIFEAQRQIILDYAEKESCVVVGRCADFILRDKKNVLNVFIYAPKNERYLNCVNALKMKPAEARSMIEKVDKARERYWRKYAGYGTADFEHTHLMINSSLFGISDTAAIIAEIAKKRFL